MNPMSSSDYLDVFVNTEQAQHSLSVWIGLAVVGLLLGGALILLMVFFFKKTKNLLPVWIIASATVLIFTLVSIFGATVSMANYQGKEKEVANHMEHNLQEKYGKQIKVVGTELPRTEDRDKRNPYLIVLPSESHQIQVSKSYEIRFDRETNEPFSEELDTASH